MKKVAGTMFLILTFVSIFCRFSLAEEAISSNLIMNAYFGLKAAGHTDTDIQDKLKKIIDGEETYQGKEWDEHLLKIKDFKDKPEATKDKIDILGATILNSAAMASEMVTLIASKDWSNLKIEKEDEGNGQYRIIIPTDIRHSKKYLKYAVDLMESSRPYIVGNSYGEDLEKILANQIRLIDLFDQVQDLFIDYLDSDNKHDKNLKEKKKNYNLKEHEYEMESQKVYVYMSQKFNQILSQSHAGLQFNAEGSAKELKTMEHKYGQ